MLTRLSEVATNKGVWKRVFSALVRSLGLALLIASFWALPASISISSLTDSRFIKPPSSNTSAYLLDYARFFFDSLIGFVLTLVVALVSISWTRVDEALDVAIYSKKIVLRHAALLILFEAGFLYLSLYLNTQINGTLTYSMTGLVTLLIAVAFGYHTAIKSYVLVGTMTNTKRMDYFVVESMRSYLSKKVKRSPENPTLYMFPTFFFVPIATVTAYMLILTTKNDRYATMMFCMTLTLFVFIMCTIKRLWDIIKPGESQESLAMHTDPFRVLPESELPSERTRHSIAETDQTYPDVSAYKLKLRRDAKAERDRAAEARREEDRL